ncbi:hypothetical protein HDG34_003198 [Paraburkholderia sp. HC6.4b]|uniref:hypothetical protein n=1 Tax=unclassified Paraburkholderia TaxID=2615204 RepID=UPI001615319A|nr:MULTISPECIES: hypothetical protein [unclassified Paraburkholderia]MBB5409257.1 hypothetical protein [Paraburkholderia sp. HC6.4b]MBB5450985.1 hypothetical protein [Paraburkholderia sp. Kb1A]
MIEIRQTGLPESGNHWSYGRDYMRRISAGSARKLCGLYPMPRMGYETIVAVANDGYGGKYHLCVQNISGIWFLACTSVPVADWPEIFQVKIVEPAREREDEKQAHLE